MICLFRDRASLQLHLQVNYTVEKKKRNNGSKAKVAQAKAKQETREEISVKKGLHK